MRTRIQPIHLYVAAVAAPSAALLGWVAVATGGGVAGSLGTVSFWVLFTVLVVAELRPVRIDHRVGGGCIALAPVFAVALLSQHGTLLTALALIAATLASDLLNRIGALRIVFNAAMYALSALVGGFLLGWVMAGPAVQNETWLIVGAAGAGAAILAVQALLTGGAVAISSRQRLSAVLVADWRFNASLMVLMISLAPAIVVLTDRALWLVPALTATTGLVYASVRRTLHDERDAFHDLLTDLPNRRFLEQRAGTTLRAAKREGRQAAIVLIDLDRFKAVNDTFGHHVGDEVLKCVALRLTNLSRGEDTVARLGGDEFAILIADVAGPAGAMLAAERMAAAIRTPITVEGLPLSIGASAGVALYPRDGEDTGALLVHADAAMYQSKQRDPGASAVAIQEHDGGPGRLALMVELSKALRNGELSLVWQPQVDPSGVIRCAEALLRWEHPLLGHVSPAVFMPLVESTDLIGPVTLHVADEAFAQLRRWLDAGVELDIAINLGARNLADSQLPRELRTRLEHHGVPAERITLEITEHCLVQDPHRTAAVLRELHALGLKISIDDFGTGFSSLSYLRSLPVTELKVDRSFVMALGEPRGATLVASIVGLARGLGMLVVAEGVEQEHLRAQVFELGFHRAQGYAIVPPLPAEDIARLVAESAPGEAVPAVLSAQPAAMEGRC